MSQINTITAPEGHWLNRGEIWVKTISSYGDTSDWVVKTQSEKDKWDAEHPEDEPNMPGGGIDDCSMKANIDGYYESMRVGTADNLTPRGDATEEVIMNRTAGGDNAVESGDALIKSIKGNSFVINQMGNVEQILIQEPFNGLTFTFLTDSIIVDGVSTAVYTYNVCRAPVIEGHDYYLHAPQGHFNAGVILRRNMVVKAHRTYNLNTIFFESKVGETFHKQRFTVMMFDLTLMFGAGNEPATPEEFAHRLGYDSIEQLPYIPYNEGEIVSCNAEGIRTTDAEGDTYERKWTSTMQKYFPRGLQSVGNVYDEITPTKAIKRISNDREILRQPEEYPYDELNLSMRVSPGCKEEAIIPEGVLSTPLRMDVVYPIDVCGTIVRNRQHIGSLDKLTTTSKTDLVSAINEIKKEVQELKLKE